MALLAALRPQPQQCASLIGLESRVERIKACQQIAVNRLMLFVDLQNCLVQNWEWPLVWEGIFTTLRLDFEVIPRPEQWVLASQTAAKATVSSRAEAYIDPARSRSRTAVVAAS